MAGKSTISKALFEKTNYPVIHLTPKEIQKKMNLSEESVSLWAAGKYYLIRELSQKIPIDIILDRFHISEYVYSELFRKGQKFDPFSIEKGLENAVLVMLNPSFKILLKRLKLRNLDVFKSQEQIAKAKKLYEKAYKKSSLPKIQIDTAQSVDKCVDIIMGFVAKNTRLKIYLAGKIGNKKNLKENWKKQVMKVLPDYDYLDPLGDPAKAVDEFMLDKKGARWREIIARDFEMIQRCSLVIANAEASVGVGAELMSAKMMGKTIVIFGKGSIFADYFADIRYPDVWSMLKNLRKDLK